MDMHTHFLRDDTRIMNFVNMRTAVGKAGWNKALAEKEQTIEDLKFDNYIKEMFLDSDTKIALISSAPSDIEQDWFLTNEQMAEAREKVNKEAGYAAPVLAHDLHAGSAGLARQARCRPRAEARIRQGLYDRRQHPQGHQPLSLAHGRREGRLQGLREDGGGGHQERLRAQGAVPAVGREAISRICAAIADVADVGQAAKDWPQLNFIIYHSAYRHVGGDPAVALAEFERTGRIAWTSDLADIPAQYGVSNVYGDVGQLFATTLIAQPRVCAALMGTLIKGLGVDHVNWGTDALWTGSPQWQIEGLRRLEIPEEMQKKYGFAPLGAADGPVKTAIFGGNNARLYGINPGKAGMDLSKDRFSVMKAEYEKNGPERSNVRYGYVHGPVDHAVFA